MTAEPRRPYIAGNWKMHKTAEEAARFVGELAGLFFDGEGRVCRPATAARLITLSEGHLRGIPEVIAVASGAAKQDAVRAALRGGLVHSLVVDSELGQALLQA